MRYLYLASLEWVRKSYTINASLGQFQIRLNPVPNDMWKSQREETATLM